MQLAWSVKALSFLDWPFGAVVYEAELMARDYPCGPIPLETNAAAGQSPTALLELLILLCFSTLCAFVWQDMTNLPLTCIYLYK